MPLVRIELPEFRKLYQENTWPEAPKIDHLALYAPHTYKCLVLKKQTEGIAGVVLRVLKDRPTEGLIGYFFSDAEHSKQSLSCFFDGLRAEARAMGLKTLYGPFNPNTWLHYRFQVEDYGDYSLSFEPRNPPWVLGQWLDQGFKETHRYYSEAYKVNLAALMEDLPTAEVCAADGFFFRPIAFYDPEKRDRELALIHQVTQIAFSKAPFFEDLDFGSFRALYVPQQFAQDRNFTGVMMSDGEGKVLGYFFGYKMNGAAILKTIALRPELQGKGLMFALMAAWLREAYQTMPDESHSTLIPALFYESNKSRGIPEKCAKHGSLLWRHPYVILGTEV